jgi:signal transduction histidine kinase
MHIVYNLVTNTLRGRIQVESRPGEGARVNIDFPRHPVEREADAR